MADEKKYLGNNSVLSIVDDATAMAMACETESSISISRDRIEVSCKDTGGYKVGFSGDRSLTASATFNYDSTDADAIALVEKIVSGNTDKLGIIWGNTVTTGGLAIKCSVTFDSVDISAPNNDVSTISFNFTSTGDITTEIKG